MTTVPHETPAPSDEHHVGHVVPFRILLGVFLSLVALTVITVGASYVDVGEFNLVVAMAIAVVKASLVILFFMHLRWDRPFNAIVFVGCLIFVAIFIAFTLIDTTQYQPRVSPDQATGIKHKPLQLEAAPGEKMPG